MVEARISRSGSSVGLVDECDISPSVRVMLAGRSDFVAVAKGSGGFGLNRVLEVVIGGRVRRASSVELTELEMVDGQYVCRVGDL